MRKRSRATVSELRGVVECLPTATKSAMLEGIRSGEIIVGAYTDRNGICPMLAAHRAGGRTNMISFARAWDRFAFRGSRKQSARRATERELLVLRTHLEASLLEAEGPSPELAAAVADHRALLARRPAEPRPPDERPRAGDHDERPRAGDHDRTREFRGREGWAWLRVFRRYDDYEDALARVEQSSQRTQREPVA
jgi:hypothetical protein